MADCQQVAMKKAGSTGLIKISLSVLVINVNSVKHSITEILSEYIWSQGGIKRLK